MLRQSFWGVSTLIYIYRRVRSLIAAPISSLPLGGRAPAIEDTRMSKPNERRARPHGTNRQAWPTHNQWNQIDITDIPAFGAIGII